MACQLSTAPQHSTNTRNKHAKFSRKHASKQASKNSQRMSSATLPSFGELDDADIDWAPGFLEQVNELLMFTPVQLPLIVVAFVHSGLRRRLRS